MEKTLIKSDEDRMNAGVKYFKNMMHWLNAENFAFNVAHEYTDYNGGFWDFFELGNGGFFLAPSREENFKWNNPMNYSEGELSPEALGVVTCLFAYSHMSFKFTDNPTFSEQYHKLREYAYNHPEASMIFRAVD